MISLRSVRDARGRRETHRRALSERREWVAVVDIDVDRRAAATGPLLVDMRQANLCDAVQSRTEMAHKSWDRENCDILDELRTSSVRREAGAAGSAASVRQLLCIGSTSVFDDDPRDL